MTQPALEIKQNDAGLEIDDPVADALLRAGEVGLGELVALGRDVVVARIVTVHEDAVRHAISHTSPTLKA